MLCVCVCAAQQPPSPPNQTPAPNADQTATAAPATNSETTRPPVPASLPNLNSLQGLTVARIEINSPALEHPDWLEPLLPQKAHQALDKYKVRQSVQVLYNTGRFSEIQVEAQRLPQDEVVLTFSARENYFFGSLRVDGAPTPPSNNQLINASKTALGEQFAEEKIDAGIQGMQRALQENGYYQATIKPFYEWDSHNQQVKVLFVVTQGAPAHVGVITVTGKPGTTIDEIMETARLHPGDRVTSKHLTRALQKLRRHFQREDRLEAQVTLTQREYHRESNTLDYTFAISRGPAVNVRVDGIKLRRGIIKKLVPIYEENAVDDDLINEGARNLRDYMQTKGYFDVQVTHSQVQSDDGQVREVVYSIDRRQRHKFADLVIAGNKYFSRDEIRERMGMQPSGGLLIYGLFSQSILARDIQSIQNLYINNGFLQVKVTSNVIDDFEGKKGRMQVTIAIAEGPQTTVGKLSIEGNSALTVDEIRGVVSAAEGQPYSDSTVVNDQTQVLDAYFNRGFPNVKLEYASVQDPNDPSKVNLTYRITEGPEIFVDRVLISGLNYTRPFVVEREMKVHTGEPLSQQKMLNTQSRLYDMGIFNEVNMAVQNPEGDSTHKSVNFQLSEAKRYTFNYGVGLEIQTGQPSGATNPTGSTGVSPRVSFDITRLNFRGRDHTVTLKTRFGNLEKLALLGYEDPRVFDAEHLSLNLTTFYEQTNDVKTFTAKRLEGAAEIKQVYSKASTFLYRFIYRRVSTDNLVIDPNNIPLFSQPVRVGLPDFSYIRDTRDNPIESRKGSFNTFDTGVASGIFGSQATFSRVVVQNSTYYQFHKRRWVFARSTRIGVEEPFGQTTLIPLPERFFAGGSTSHRGFGINQAGPRDLFTGFPLGGDALFVNNLEIRTPPLPFPYVGDNLSAVLFHDMGNVFATSGDMVNSIFKFAQPNRSTCLNPTGQSCNFNYNSQAVGAGIRYRTPVGPVSIDLGYNLNPPAFPIGAPPSPAVPSSQVLKHFNFFFNIGQTF